MTKIFISHAHSDMALASCLKQLIVGVFGDEVSVDFSSDQSMGGGIPSGAEWLPWILEKIRESDVTIVLVTPESANRPWLMWEAGAVSGIALALGAGTVIIPLLFRLEKEKVPGPLAARQAEQGESDDGIRRVLLGIHSIVKEPEERVLNYLFNDYIPKYHDAVRAALFDRPIPLTEDVVDEWCHRLDELGTKGGSARSGTCSGPCSWPSPRGMRLSGHRSIYASTAGWARSSSRPASRRTRCGSSSWRCASCPRTSSCSNA